MLTLLVAEEAFFSYYLSSRQDQFRIIHSVYLLKVVKCKKMPLNEEFESILKLYTEKLEHPVARQDTHEFQLLLASAIERLLQLKTTIYSELSLFSANESQEDISTSSLKFLSIDFYLACMCSKKQMTSSQSNDTIQRNRMKLRFLEKTVQLFMQFLVSLQDFEILDPYLSKKIDKFENSLSPTLQELYNQPARKDDLSGAQLKRQQKIEMYRQTKAINEKIAALESRYKNLENTDAVDYDEVLRELHLQKLQGLSYEAINLTEQTLYEMELLENFTNSSPQPEKILKEQKQDSDGFTDRLETLNKPLLSKEGKVLRNFTLIDKRTQLRNKVRGYGQYGPTMSVEEFLEKEWEEGRVLQGGGESQPSQGDEDEDNIKLQNEKTYKARQWDEFKEANPRGSGNTMNRG